MNSNSIENNRQHATIVIETTPITSTLEQTDERPGLRCFLSAAWDLKADRCLDQGLSYGETLAKATLNAVSLLLQPSARPTGKVRGCHLSRYYWYRGVRHEVCALHNGCVWLRPVGLTPWLAAASPRDVPRADRDRRMRPLLTTLQEPSRPAQGLGSPTAHLSLARQPEEIQWLIGRHAHLMYEGKYATKSELSRWLQAHIRRLNQSRPTAAPLKVPSLKTKCWLIDKYFRYSLGQGFAAKRSFIRSAEDVGTQHRWKSRR